MFVHSFDKVGSPGVITDISPRDLPPPAWTQAHNVVVKGTGLATASPFAEIPVVPAVAPTRIHYVDDLPTGPMYVFAGGGKIYALLNNTPTDITRVSGNYSSDLWDFHNFNGVLIANNGVDTPQVWNPIATATKLVDLPNWPANTKAKIVRSFLNYMVALNVTKATTTYDQMVKWSHFADPGFVPSTWDPTDTTKDAGENSLQQGTDALVTCLQMDNTLILYKQHSIWVMRFIQGVFLFRFDPVVNDFGPLNSRCVAQLPNGTHVILGAGDIRIFNGRETRSIIDNRLKGDIFNKIDNGNYAHVFIQVDPQASKVWFFVPNIGDSFTTTAFVWDLKIDSFTTVDVPRVDGATFGPVFYASDDPFNSASGTIDSDANTFDYLPSNPARNFLTVSSGSDNKLYIYGGLSGNQVLTNPVLLERIALPLSGVNQDGTPRVEFSTRKLITEIWPRLETSTCDSVRFYLGTQEVPEASITWEGPFDFNPLEDEFLPVWVSGKILSIRIEIDAGEVATLLGYDVRGSLVGRPS